VRYRFGRFVLSPARRVLCEEGDEVALIPRYFDLLLLLVEQRDRAVTRQEIFDRVWADVVVSDGALTQAIRTIRRVLDDDPREVTFIRTVSRHGYQFVWAPVAEEADEGPLGQVHSHDGTMGRRHDEPELDLFAPLLEVLLAEGPSGAATEDERYDAAVRLHELGTDEALRRLDERPGHEEARAILRDARWDAPSSGHVPLLSAEGRLRAIADVVALRARRAVHLASRRWASASASAGLAGLIAGIGGGVALGLLPESDTGAEVAVALAMVGTAAGALGGAGIGAGLAAAESLARSARAAALTLAGAIAGLATGWLAHWLVRSLLGGVFGRDVAALAGSFEGLIVGAAVGAGYAVATRRLSQGGMAAPRGHARWRVALTTGATTAVAAMVLALAGRHLVGSSLDLMADTFAGSQVGLDPLARLLGEDSLRPITRTLVSGFEALMFGSGLAFGLTRRPRV
jgi:DNA-binding winged helix-turn-helix (wHTH) protein